MICTFCNRGSEDIQYFFWDCSEVLYIINIIFYCLCMNDSIKTRGKNVSSRLLLIRARLPPQKADRAKTEYTEAVLLAFTSLVARGKSCLRFY